MEFIYIQYIYKNVKLHLFGERKIYMYMGWGEGFTEVFEITKLRTWFVSFESIVGILRFMSR